MNNSILNIIQKVGDSSANILSLLVLIYYIIDRICSIWGSPELRLIKKQFTDLNKHIETLINKVS